MEKEKLIELISGTVRDLNTEAIGITEGVYNGKVRDILDLGDKLLIFTSDRISAFDRILTTIPCKGEVLNETTLFWFEKTADILPNHIIKKVSPRTILVQKCEIIPLEIIVRGYLTGSAWRDYSKGNPVSGIRLPEGMSMDQAFETPLITPTTKAAAGHDMPISREEILSQGLVPEPLWKTIEEKALALFARATEMAGAQGLILVDTKFEFGLLDGELICCDEIFTPDSSRYWYKESYQELFKAGKEQRKLDKEYLRRWLMDKNYMGDGEPPVIPEDVRAETAIRYIEAYENITGKTFSPTIITEEEELKLIKKEI